MVLLKVHLAQPGEIARTNFLLAKSSKTQVIVMATTQKLTTRTTIISGPPQLNESINLLLAPGVLETIKEETTRYATENLETGGILVGKWLDENTVVIIAATDAGPEADHQLLTFAIDIEYANQELERLASVFSEVEYIGQWHKHPPTLDHPSSGDWRTVMNSFKDPEQPHRLITPISVYRNSKPLVGFFHISSTTRRFERVRPRQLTLEDLQELVPYNEEGLSALSRKPAEIKPGEPAWWTNLEAVKRLEEEETQLQELGELTKSGPIDESTWLVEVLPDGFKRQLRIEFECSGRYDAGDTPVVRAYYKGEAIQVLSSRLASWNQESRLVLLVEDIKRQVNRMRYRPFFLTAGAIGLGLLLVAALIMGLVFGISTNDSQVSVVNQTSTAFAASNQTVGVQQEQANTLLSTASAQRTEDARIFGAVITREAAKQLTESAQLSATNAALSTQIANANRGTPLPSPVTTSTQVVGPTRPKVHLVQQGDYLNALAARYKTSVQAIVSANSDPAALGQTNKILMDLSAIDNPRPYAGVFLVIPVDRPDFRGRAIILQKGQTIEEIVSKYHKNKDDLLKFNGVTEVKESDPLLIPGN